MCSRAADRPRPPILIGGGGEKKTLLQVARYADACNLFGTGIEDVTRKLEVLRGHCEAEGRDYDAIRETLTSFTSPAGDPGAFLAEAEQYAALGITQIDVMPDGDPIEYTEKASAVIERLGSI